MGFLDKIVRNMPGGPLSIAKSMLRAYNIYLRANPGCPKEDARRYCIETRYKVIKILNQDEIEKILTDTPPDLGILVYACIRRENPAAFEYPFTTKTLDDLCSFFTKNVPEESKLLWELRREVNAKFLKKWGINA